MNNQRPGYIKSAVLKAGIKVSPVAIAEPGYIAHWFKIEVTKKTKDGRTIRPKNANTDKRYPAKSTKDKPSVYDKINEIEKYYYDKIMKNKAA